MTLHAPFSVDGRNVRNAFDVIICTAIDAEHATAIAQHLSYSVDAHRRFGGDPWAALRKDLAEMRSALTEAITSLSASRKGTERARRLFGNAIAEQAIETIKRDRFTD